MAEKRMFTRKITESDAFLDMPLSAQCLYFHLNMNADDDGFVNNPKRILRSIAASEDDLKILIAKSFVLVFESGVIVIKHWRMNNTLQKDRYRPTDYQEEFEMLGLKPNKSYTWKQNVNILETEWKQIDTTLEADWNQNGTTLEPQNRLDKIRLDKNSIYGSQTKRFTKPTIEQVREYCQERNNTVDAERFIDYYEANGWKVGKAPMKDWKAAVRNWERNEPKPKTKQQKDIKDISLEDIYNGKY